MRNVPNLLTLSRMLAAVLLCLCRPFSMAFYCVYLYGGISDVLDGLLARRLHKNVPLGARLDSIADLLFTGAALYVLLPAAFFERRTLLWAVGIACLRLLTFCIGLCKYRALPFLHTLSNKLTGALLFLFPVLYVWPGPSATEWILCIAASLSATEELILTLSRPTLDRDCRGLLFRP